MIMLSFLFAIPIHAVQIEPQLAAPATPAVLAPPASGAGAGMGGVIPPGGGAIPPVVPLRPMPGPAIINPNGPTPIVHSEADSGSEKDGNAEMQALMNAFGMLGGGGGGGGGSSSGGGGGRYSDGRSEVAYAGDGDGVASLGRGSSSLTPVGSADLAGTKRIIGAFQKWFDTCTKQKGLGSCKFANMGIAGDASHRARRSCHNSGEAIDVGPITCGGRKFESSSPQFFDLAKCMANDSNNELQVIFYKAEGPNMMRKADHSQHMHIQLKNCRMVYGGGR